MTAPTRYLSLAIAIAVSLTTNAMAGVTLKLSGDTPANSFPDDGFTRVTSSAVANIGLSGTATTTRSAPSGYKLGDAVLKLTTSQSTVGATFSSINSTNNSYTATLSSLDQNLNEVITLKVEASFPILKSDSTPSGFESIVETSNQISFLLDSEPPKITDIVVERFPGGGGIVQFQLEDSDLKESSLAGSSTFKVVHTPLDGDKALVSIPVAINGPATYDARTRRISLAFANLNPGDYSVTIANLSDRFDKLMQIDQSGELEEQFSAPGGRLQGPHVEFPRFLRPNGDSSGFNPADRVDTRVVDLYYFRDAARVAQVINRNVRDLDRVGYDAAQQFAKRARDDSRIQIDERRQLESLAVQDAQRTRQSERELETKQQELQSALKQQDQITVRQNQVNAIIEGMGIEGVANAADVDAKIAGLTTIILADEKSLKQLTDSTELRNAATTGATTSPAMVAAANAVKAADRAVTANNDRDDDALTERRAQDAVERAENDLAAKKVTAESVRVAHAAMPTPTAAATLALNNANLAVTSAETTLTAAQSTLTSAQNRTSTSTLAARNAEEDAAVAAQRAAPLVNAEQTRLTTEIRNNRSKRSALQTVKAQVAISTKEVARNTALVSTLEGELAALPGRIAEQKETEITSRNKVAGAERKELRLEQERFRREVAAGIYDRDTFVAGKVTSRDPVTQVSITVLGTARLQLRGPIQGINKIRRMIHQIDSPVGQVKVGIHTIQINGEHGDRMDKVHSDINKEIAHSRFLVNTSTRLFQKAVVRIATVVGNAVENGHVPPRFPSDLGNKLRHGTSEEDHRWRYIYTFFGADFINELRRMNSELLQQDNKLLSLHSMDSLSFAGALYVTSLARGSVRETILHCFDDLLKDELPQREYEYLKNLNQVHLKFGRLYRPSQHTLAKMDAKLCQEVFARAARLYTFPNTTNFFSNQAAGDDTLNPVQHATIRMAQVLKAQLVAEREYKNIVLERSLLETVEGETEIVLAADLDAKQRSELQARVALSGILEPLQESQKSFARPQVGVTDQQRNYIQLLMRNFRRQRSDVEIAGVLINSFERNADKDVPLDFAQAVVLDIVTLIKASQPPSFPVSREIDSIDTKIALDLILRYFGKGDEVQQNARRWRALQSELTELTKESTKAKQTYEAQRKLLLSKRLLEQFMDETEEKSVELLEALRSHASNVDNYLKRLAIAVEDDVNAQFYEPAFQRVRHASRSWDVNLGQVETTTILTNNRTLAKVSPSATMEFDLPKRDILLTEAFKGSKALATEYGNLMQDGTFLAGSAMLAGTPAGGIAGGVSPVQAIPGVRPGQRQEFGSGLEKLIPDPSVYKFETGTGFEIRPVIQPDGHSIVYTFDYTYTTNVREPLRADEKHLGRVKRHFVHTDVQTSSYELREVSRYMVSLKASRTARGVPLLEDVPFLGAAFRPLPSAESSLQQNVILASSVIYPTMFDLMGLRWSQYADDVHSDRLVEEKQKQLSRQRELRRHLLETTRDRVNSAIGIHNSIPASELLIPPGPRVPN